MHYGLTSSDVVDTALALQMTRALDVILPAAEQLESAIAARAREFRDTPMVGRTHGIHAEPTTFGMKLALWAMQVRRDRERLARARDTIAVGKLSGAVGTFSNIDPSVERYVCERLGLTAGARHAGAARATATPKCSTRARRWDRASSRSRSRSGTCSAPRCAKPKRRSARARRAPARCRTSATRSSRSSSAAWPASCAATSRPALEDIALWHERDISHSSVERIILPDSLMLAYYVIVQCTKVISGLRVHPERMLRNLDASFGLVFSQPVLLALVEAGAGRDDVYRMVQRNAMQAWQEERSFRDLLVADPDVRGRARRRAPRRLLRPQARPRQRRPHVRRARPDRGDTTPGSA